jgi:hypothetical protein
MEPIVSDQDLLQRFGLVSEENLAKLLGLSVKTLKNRAHSDLPEFVKAGRRRLFKEDSVRRFLDRHVANRE